MEFFKSRKVNLKLPLENLGFYTCYVLIINIMKIWELLFRYYCTQCSFLLAY